jgi:hypothetical protein
MAGVSATGEQALVTPDWVESRIGDAMVRVIEIAGIGQDDMQAYKEGHVPGAACWEWKDLLWDAHARDFPAPDEFARRLGHLASHRIQRLSFMATLSSLEFMVGGRFAIAATATSKFSTAGVIAGRLRAAS